MKYQIQTIDHKDQPYNTVADWRFSNDSKTCYINVSDTGDTDYNNALALHETTEIMQLLRLYTPKQAVDKVDRFDEEFEKNRTEWESEPGDSPKAPYWNEHSFATVVERCYLASQNRNWKEYEDTLTEMMKGYKNHGNDKS